MKYIYFLISLIQNKLKLFVKIFLVFIFLSEFLVTNAQLQYGVKAGYNQSNLIISPIDSRARSKPNFNLGFLVSIPLFKTCTLQPEIMYSGQGMSAVSQDLGSVKLNYDYLNIPILFKYQNSTGLFAESGPQYGYLLYANYKAQGFSLNLKQDVNYHDFSWAFGLGYQFKNIGLGVDLRYNLGLTRTEGDDFITVTQQSVRNSVFQFSLFYVFPKREP